MLCHRRASDAGGLQRLGKRLLTYMPAEVVTENQQKPEVKPRVVVGYGFSCSSKLCAAPHRNSESAADSTAGIFAEGI
jgi:hypothetical protein